MAGTKPFKAIGFQRSYLYKNSYPINNNTASKNGRLHTSLGQTEKELAPLQETTLHEHGFGHAMQPESLTLTLQSPAAQIKVITARPPITARVQRKWQTFTHVIRGPSASQILHASHLTRDHARHGCHCRRSRI